MCYSDPLMQSEAVKHYETLTGTNNFLVDKIIVITFICLMCLTVLR